MYIMCRRILGVQSRDKPKRDPALHFRRKYLGGLWRLGRVAVGGCTPALACQMHIPESLRSMSSLMARHSQCSTNVYDIHTTYEFGTVNGCEGCDEPIESSSCFPFPSCRTKRCLRTCEGWQESVWLTPRSFSIPLIVASKGFVLSNPSSCFLGGEDVQTCKMAESSCDASELKGMRNGRDVA